MISQKIKRFIERNKGALVRKSIAEASARAYLNPKVRKAVTSFSKVREPRVWLFMGGCYNSGTTILRELLGSHSMVSALPREGVRFTTAFPNLEKNGWTRMWWKNADLAELPDEKAIERVLQAKTDWAPWWKSGTDIFLEKSISHGSRMAWLDRHFENARFVGVIRNGYCAAEGIRRRARASGEALEELRSEVYPIELAGQQWVTANEHLLRDMPKLKHFHLVRYEDFVTNPIDHIQKLCNFLELDAYEAELVDEGKISFNGRIFTISNMNDSSIERLTPKDIKTINPVIKTMMDRLGYPIIESSE